MDRDPVQSRSLAEVGYCPDTMVLEIAFHNGSVYQYFDVSETAFLELTHAESIGRHFNAHIRPNYRCSQV